MRLLKQLITWIKSILNPRVKDDSITVEPQYKPMHKTKRRYTKIRTGCNYARVPPRDTQYRTALNRVTQ